MASLGASMTSESAQPALLRYFDVVLVVVAAPIMIAIGASAAGYAIGGGAWIALRAAGEVLERNQALHADARTDVSVRLVYMLLRLFLLAIFSFPGQAGLVATVDDCLDQSAGFGRARIIDDGRIARH